MRSVLRRAVSFLPLLPFLPFLPLVFAQTDPTGHWRTLTSTHFHLHVRVGHEALAARAAIEAESAWAALAQHLPPPRGRIDLVVTDHWDLANGFASVFPVPRVVVFVAPPAGDLELGAYDRWLRLVITHELAHVFHLEPARGIWGLGRTLFGRAPPLFPNAWAPTWITEGLATFYESRLTPAGRLAGSHHAAIVRAQAAERGALPVDAAGGLSPRWPGGLRPYAFGAAFFRTLAERHGDSAVASFVREQSSRLIPYIQLGQAVRRASGSPLGETWASAQVADTAAGAERGAALLARQRDPVPFDVDTAGRIALVRDDGRDVPRLVTLEGDRWRTLGVVNLVTGIAWDTGGAVIVAQLEFDGPYALRSDLWRYTPDGRRARLTRGARLREVDVAPDGAIVAARLTPGGADLVLIAGGDTARLVPAEDGVEWAQPRFSPDGRMVAAVRVGDGRHDIVRIARSGGAPQPVTDDAALDRAPAWRMTAAGPEVVWTRDESGAAVIATIAEGTLVRLHEAPFAAWAPAGAGDGLLVWSYHADGWRLVRVPPRDLSVTPLPITLLPVTPLPVTPLPDTPLSLTLLRPYRPSIRPRYWLPVAVAGSLSTWIGAATSGSDVLERWSYYLLGQAGFGVAKGQWRGAVGVAWAGIRPVVVDVAYDRDQLSSLDSTGAVFCCVDDAAAEFGVTALRRRWRSTVALRGALGYERFAARERWGVAAALSASNAVRPALGVSLQDGARAAATVRHWRRPATGLSSTEFTGRLSLYQAWPTGGFARQVTALRLAAGTITGNDPARFAVGGTPGEAVALLSGIVVGGGRTFPLRGAVPGEAAGRSVATVSLEHRFPFALVGRGMPWFIPAQLDRLSVSVFADGAFTRSAGVGASYGSVGGELVFDLGAGDNFPFRLRGGLAQRLDRDARAGYFSLGSSF